MELGAFSVSLAVKDLELKNTSDGSIGVRGRELLAAVPECDDLVVIEHSGSSPNGTMPTQGLCSIKSLPIAQLKILRISDWIRFARIGAGRLAISSSSAMTSRRRSS